jgi:uncharacterized protein with ParB-like and HNH nuclease domain
MADTVFSPEHKTINSIFERDVKYLIPAYQRPYSWENLGKNDRNNQINNMWDDFYTLFVSGENTEYFFGSIVVYKEDESFNVVDGQQRLTSLLLLFSAMKCFLTLSKQNRLDEEKENISNFMDETLQTINDILFNREGILVKSILKVKIESSGSNSLNVDEILNKAINCESKESILKGIDKKYKDVIMRYFDNRDYFIKRLEENFLTNKKFLIKDVEKFDKFWKLLRTKISIVMIKTTDLKTAFSIFEVLNNRGLPLTNKDLFRNFLIRIFHQAGSSNSEKKWNYLENSYNLTSDFLGRFIESRKAYQANKSSYNAIIDYYEKDTNQDIQLFYNELEKYLKYYTMITNEDNILDKCIKNKIRFLRLLGYERNTINYLMALFNYFSYDGEQNSELLTHITLYEKMRLYILLKPRKRFSTVPIYHSIKDLNEGKFEDSKKYFIESTETDDLKRLIDDKIKDNSIGKLLIAKYLYTLNCTIKDVVEYQEVNYSKSTLEHIIPQNPESKSNWLNNFSDDFRKEYTYKLGNFTLLTTNMNLKAKNYDFERKKIEYMKTLLSITKEFENLDNSSMNEKYIKDRHIKIIEAIYSNLEIRDVAK